jgi:hypothetical protein
MNVGHEETGWTLIITALSNAPGKINELDQLQIHNL